jgi:hypothetical protein
MASPRTSNPRKSANNYRKNPASYKNKLEYDKQYNAREDRKQYRRDHGRARYAAQKMGMAVTGRDMSRNSDGSYSVENSSTNRARNGHGKNRRYK